MECIALKIESLVVMAVKVIGWSMLRKSFCSFKVISAGITTACVCVLVWQQHGGGWLMVKDLMKVLWLSKASEMVFGFFSVQYCLSRKKWICVKKLVMAR